MDLFLISIIVILSVSAIVQGWSIGPEQIIQGEGTSIKTGFLTLTILSAIATIAISIILVRKLHVMKKKNGSRKDQLEKSDDHDSNG